MKFRRKFVIDKQAYTKFGTKKFFMESIKDSGKLIDSGLNFHSHIIVIMGQTGAIFNRVLQNTVYWS